MPGTTHYIDSVTSGTNGYISLDDPHGLLVTGAKISKEKGISPQLYFRFAKRKLKTLEKMKFDRRIKRLEAAFDQAAKNGQDMLAKKILDQCIRGAKESAIYAAGFRLYIEQADLNKHKHNIKNGHISDTKFSQFTRVIPKSVLANKEKTEGLFDGYVIYHYWSKEAGDVKNMSPEEKAAMKDPILFGVIKESNRLYFIDDWEDEHCDLTFDEIVDVVGDDNVGELTSKLDIDFETSDK